MNTNPIKMIMKHNHPHPFTKLQLLSHTLNAILAFGSLCFVFLTFDLLKTGIFRSWGIAVLLFYLMMMTTGLLRQIPVQFKAISGILFFYSLSFMIMLHPGMTGFPLIYFLAVSGVTGLFFGFSAGFITCIIHLIFLFSITGLHSFSFIFNPQQNLPPAADAADFVITFFVFNLVVVHLSAWAAKSLDAQEKRVTNFIELIDTVVFAMDPDYNITQANKKITDILGYTLDEWVGSNLLDFLPPEKKRRIKQPTSI